ncbi:MAG: restriction endonuclease subunit S [Methylophaga sp.]
MIEKVGSLPKGWVELPLGEVIHSQKGKKPSDLGEQSDHRTIPYINIKAFEKGIFTEFAPEQDMPYCEEKDILLVWDGARAGLAGRGVKGYVGSTLARIDSDLVNSDYLFHFMHSIYGVLNTQTKGVGIPHINPNVLNNIPFYLPPENEQSRIVEKLEELLSDLDDGVTELKVSQIKLSQYRQSLLKSAVESSLTAEWLEQNKPKETGEQLLQRILKERREHWEKEKLAEFEAKGKKPPKDWQKKYPEAVQPDVTDLPILPEGWTWASVDQLVSKSSYGTSVKSDYDSKFTAILRIPNLINKKIDISNLKFSTKDLNLRDEDFLQTGDILIVRTNGSISLVGQTAAIPDDFSGEFYFASYLLRVRPLISRVLPFWMDAYFSSQPARKWIERNASSSAGQNNISLSTFLTLPVPLPSLHEQNHINTKLSYEFTKIQEQVEKNDKLLLQAQAQRKNILKDAFNGQLVYQNSQDEPASVLLEKIRLKRVERNKQATSKRTMKTTSKKAKVMEKLEEVLKNKADWIDAQQAFKECGVIDGTGTDRIEELYSELRKLNKENRLIVERRGKYDMLRLKVE